MKMPHSKSLCCSKIAALGQNDRIRQHSGNGLNAFLTKALDQIICGGIQSVHTQNNRCRLLESHQNMLRIRTVCPQKHLCDRIGNAV